MEEYIMHGRDAEPDISARVGEYVSGDCEIEQDGSEPYMAQGSGAGSESAMDGTAERPAS